MENSFETHESARKYNLIEELRSNSVETRRFTDIKCHSPVSFEPALFTRRSRKLQALLPRVVKQANRRFCSLQSPSKITEVHYKVMPSNNSNSSDEARDIPTNPISQPSTGEGIPGISSPIQENTPQGGSQHNPTNNDMEQEHISSSDVERSRIVNTPRGIGNEISVIIRTGFKDIKGQASNAPYTIGASGYGNFQRQTSNAPYTCGASGFGNFQRQTSNAPYMGGASRFGNIQGQASNAPYMCGASGLGNTQSPCPISPANFQCSSTCSSMTSGLWSAFRMPNDQELSPISTAEIPNNETNVRPTRTESVPAIVGEFHLYPRASYADFEPFLLEEKQLKSNGFPFPDTSPGKAMFFSIEPTENSPTICVRCKKVITQIQSPCIYHKLKAKPNATLTSCCKKRLSSPGCVSRPYHVHMYNKFNDLENYIQFGPPLPRLENDVNVFAIDCEMVYTDFGFELARATVVNVSGEVVYDQFVRPSGALLDPNTEYSGLRAEDIEQATTRLADVQNDLKTILDSDSILIGHSLENDLIALKIIHQKVVDTSVVFTMDILPNRKRSLKHLTKLYLNRNIQVVCHDSAEDAKACINLMEFAIFKNRPGFWRMWKRE
nr:rna exonuclease 1 [Hymenolepis microstoma]